MYISLLQQPITKYKILQTGWLKQQKCISPLFWRLEVQGQIVRRLGVCRGLSPWLANGPPSWCVLTWPFLWAHVSLVSLCMPKFPLFFFFFFFFFLLATLQYMEVPRSGMEPAPQQHLELLQWQRWILNLWPHKGTPDFPFLQGHQLQWSRAHFMASF